MKDLAKSIVSEAIAEINQELDETGSIGLQSDFELLSASSSIDSLTLVRLLISVERIIEEKTGKSVVVVDESAFETDESPFSTVGSLTGHVSKLIQ
jgi:hypothetical protein